MTDEASRARRFAEYLKLSRLRPDLFASPPGGVEVILDPAQISQVEEEIGAKLEARGLPREQAEVGILVSDPWFMVIRDAVRFPDGSRRTHARVVNHLGHGAAVLPVLDGRIVLVRHFRHAIRGWSIEVPRGGLEPGRTPEETARTEIEEEIEGRVRSLVRLGFLHGANNTFSGGGHLFLARLEAIGAGQLSEGIDTVLQITVDQFEQRVLSGEIVDAFTVAAFAHARLRGFL